MIGRLYTSLLLVQGIYTLVTALWALIDIESFMKVTGPKTDIWLVKTVAVILVAIGLTLLSFVNRRTDALPAIILGASTSLGLAAIDFYYTSHKVISRVYAADGVGEVIFFILWVIIFLRRKELNVNNR